METDKKLLNYCSLELWGGIECTINRIEDFYHDQLYYSKHYFRDNDIEKIANLGITTIRYPLLWEYHKPQIEQPINWNWAEGQLNAIRSKGITPIVGLVHHGSGPIYTNLLSDNFITGLVEYASEVAQKFPWINYYTPVNEPLTTARFSGLYGFWYPHHQNDISFAKILLNQLKAVVLCMQAIRKVNPLAKLVQTEDLGKTYSTPYLTFQANFENERRWLSFDILCGRLNPGHIMWKYFLRLGISEELLHFFLANPCPPEIVGLNHYVTSERFIDENIDNYPTYTHGTNEIQTYADIEAIRVKHDDPHGLKVLLKEAWERYGLTMAVTEAHLNSTREEQLRWLFEIWNTCKELKSEGINIKAVTAWSLLGAFGWNRLLTSPQMEYETGVFDIRSGSLRPTALANLIKAIISNQSHYHPVLNHKGWWHRESRYIKKLPGTSLEFENNCHQPVIIIGKTGTLGYAFAKLCTERFISYRLLGRDDVDIRDAGEIEEVILKYNPWAIINTAGFVKVDEAELEIQTCFEVNAKGAELLANACKKFGIQYLTFSTDMVFDGSKGSPYLETDEINPLNIYGKSKAKAEFSVSNAFSQALTVRTSSFFGPWDKYNFVHMVIKTISENEVFTAADNIVISPTYVPDLVNVCLDLLIDKETGIWHLTNKGELTWAELGKIVAEKAGYNAKMVVAQPYELMNWKAIRPKYSVLESKNGILMPSLKNALNRYFVDRLNISARSKNYNN